ncbi:MAG TPA: gephyrin-like molybdotransferase Glp [Anaeromyxobacter sp.]|nr:gephyrin-like molybdotransferase Glp [Anaeromyxobacter sp.]
MLAPAQAVRRILSTLSDVAPLPGERVPLSEALGRVVAEPVRAPADLPAFDASTMDGYALRAADAPRSGTRLPIAFEVLAGHPARGPLPPGSCCRITTGAPLPEGADAVEMQEQVRRAGGGARFLRAGERGRFVRHRASDLAAGEVALPAGAVVDPGAVGLTAGLGSLELVVHRRPRVAILPTGDELVSPGGPLAPGQAYESNGLAVAAALREAGAEPFLLPVARDDARALAQALRAAEGCDALVTNGGASVGARDLVRSALAAAGAEVHFWKVAMRPGKPFLFGRWGRAAVFGLPGNPASALVTLELFVRPALRALGGLPGHGRLEEVAALDGPQEKPAELEVYLRVRLRRGRAGLVAEPLRTQASGHHSSATGHDALAILPAGRSRLPAGARVAVRVLRVPAGR